MWLSFGVLFGPVNMKYSELMSLLKCGTYDLQTGNSKL